MVRWLFRGWLIWAGARIVRDVAWTDGNPAGELAILDGDVLLGKPFAV